MICKVLFKCSVFLGDNCKKLIQDEDIYKKLANIRVLIICHFAMIPFVY